MAVVTPPARIGKTTGVRPRPANSEKLPRGAAFHVASEAGNVPSPKRKAVRGKKAKGLINGA